MRIWTLAKTCAPPAAPSGWVSVCSFEERRAARPDGSPVRSGCSTRQRDCVEQGYLLLPVAEQHLAAGDGEAAYVTAAGAAEIGDRFGEADLIACARHLQGRALMQQGQVQAGARAAGRGHGRGHRGGAVAHHDGSDLLQRDRGLPAGVRVGPCPRVDLRAGAVVRAATRDGRLHRHLPGASRGDHAAARRLARTRSRRRGAPASVSPRESTSSPPPRRSTSKPRCTACEGSSRRPRRRTEMRAGGDGNRSRDWPCCGWPKDARTPRPLRSAAS